MNMYRYSLVSIPTIYSGLNCSMEQIIVNCIMKLLFVILLYVYTEMIVITV